MGKKEPVKKMTNDELLEHLFTKQGAEHIKKHVQRLDAKKGKRSKKADK